MTGTNVMMLNLMRIMSLDRNYTALRTHVQWSVRLSSLLIT